MVRFKNRYIAVQIDNGKDITQPLKLTSLDFYNEIINVVQYLHGDVGSAVIKPGLNVKYCNELTKVAIVRVRHGPHKIVTSVLPFIQDIKAITATVKVLYVGATLLHCYKVLLRHQKTELNKVLPLFKSTDERQLLESKLLTLDSLNALYAKTSSSDFKAQLKNQNN